MIDCVYPSSKLFRTTMTLLHVFSELVLKLPLSPLEQCSNACQSTKTNKKKEKQTVNASVLHECVCVCVCVCVCARTRACVCVSQKQGNTLCAIEV